MLPVGRFSFMICSSDSPSKCLTMPRRELPWAAIRIWDQKNTNIDWHIIK